MGVKLIKISVVYFVLGVLLGLYMSMAQNYSYTGVHAHMNLLGWSSLTLAGILYLMFPRAGSSLSGKIHFWLHNLGLPLMMIGLFMGISGYTPFLILIPIGGMTVVLAILVFAFNVMKNISLSDYSSS
ncbi:cytochrome-c oxidase [Gracilibacillus alcaliphilus]|uniref:cytochrome-c oxidase n=1 Tax=Gracilibacillus alcaliphilus TaxID=1401441 RepID=UPI00195D6CB1|nr:cytochrome-c oxidase [Gracilibacillus alcaliphilus]MBM7675354.1 cbb3-type cytochrome oxidase subunit 1 [Gracilibacillus alcaliphilus]